MKNILLAKKSKRIFARLIDMAIVIFFTVFIYSIAILPNVLDQNEIQKNGNEITKLYTDSKLFIVDENGNYNAKCAFNEINTLEELYSIELTYNGKVYQEVSLTKSLYEYYTTLFNQYGSSFNLTEATYKNEILKINTEESNILDYDVNTNTLTLIDSEKSSTTVSYFISTYQSACKNLISNSKINDLTQKNQQIVLSAAGYIIPLLFLISFIFDLLIPLLSPTCQSIGKKIFKLSLVTKDGFKYPKPYLIIRWLSYLIIEFILGIATIGGMLLISYTMFLFCKKRRCIHDFIANSVVIDESHSIYFANAKEENYYNNRKQSGEING